MRRRSFETEIACDVAEMMGDNRGSHARERYAKKGARDEIKREGRVKANARILRIP